ncbi:MAG: hypothetical protein EPO00_08400 [Chloroflexota bacterium]|nr:MAG: hypothetical protein EPO00_08400 [Chloroflexota bacterium]
MEGSSVAHTLPELYRHVLERVASLEHLGLRGEALLIRRSAIREYSRAWDERAVARMTTIRIRAERVLDGVDRARSIVGPRPAALRSKPATRRSQPA